VTSATQGDVIGYRPVPSTLGDPTRRRQDYWLDPCHVTSACFIAACTGKRISK